VFIVNQQLGNAMVKRRQQEKERERQSSIILIIINDKVAWGKERWYLFDVNTK
jgi:hypothetical protein